MLRRVVPFLLLAALLGTEILDQNVLLRVPGQRTGIVERMKHPKSHLRPHHRYPDGAQPQAQFTVEFCRLGLVQRLVGQPLDDGTAQNTRRCLHIVHAWRPYPKLRARPVSAPRTARRGPDLRAMRTQCRLMSPSRFPIGLKKAVDGSIDKTASGKRHFECRYFGSTCCLHASSAGEN